VPASKCTYVPALNKETRWQQPRKRDTHDCFAYPTTPSITGKPKEDKKDERAALECSSRPRAVRAISMLFTLFFPNKDSTWKAPFEGHLRLVHASLFEEQISELFT
jgi:hypothetical protein